MLKQIIWSRLSSLSSLKTYAQNTSDAIMMVQYSFSSKRAKKCFEVQVIIYLNPIYSFLWNPLRRFVTFCTCRLYFLINQNNENTRKLSARFARASTFLAPAESFLLDLLQVYSFPPRKRSIYGSSWLSHSTIPCEKE